MRRWLGLARGPLPPKMPTSSSAADCCPTPALSSTSCTRLGFVSRLLRRRISQADQELQTARLFRETETVHKQNHGPQRNLSTNHTTLFSGRPERAVLR